MPKYKVCIVGGTGFVGSRVVATLVEQGHDVTIPTRRRERHRDLLVLPTATVVEGDVHNPAFLRQLVEGHDAVVNMVGILNERGHNGRGFARAHAELPAKIVEACRQGGVRRLLHMSALHAALQGPSHYLRTKAMGEDTVHRAHGPELAVTSFRASVIFGPRDSFTNRFADVLRLTPGILPLACAGSRFQPIYVEDVVHCITSALDHHKTFGARYDLCGPKVYTLGELVAYIAGLIGKRVRIIPLNPTLSWLQAAVLEWVPGKPFSLDNYRSLQVDSVCSKPFPDVFGIRPTALEDIAPRYLGAGNRERRYSRLRSRAARE
jgi:NADH dehydrogenase